MFPVTKLVAKGFCMKFTLSGIPEYKLPFKYGVKFHAEGSKTYDYLVVGRKKEKNQQ